MHWADVEESGGGSRVDEQDGDHPATVPSQPRGLGTQEVERSSEREELLLAMVRRLEAELERHRAQAARTEKLLLSATNYADWVRERARRDAELALRKATARVEKLALTTRELEQTQQELVRLKDELVRLQALTDETRARLSAFLTDGLRVLNADIETGRANDPEPALERLDDTLHRQLPSTLFAHGQLPSTSAAEPMPREQAETQAEH